ncbi:MAG: glycogen/starch synthase [Bacteroidales bacterium]|nr:glycogen/starch synthase [Bacteroidales bacterium]
MDKTRVLFISQEITPYLPESEMSVIGRYLPQGIQEKGREIRTFMPRFGNVNERRNQLHEVIRLSGMNLIINDTDHPLIIKVASIQSARMQVYFIDNEDYFHRKAIFQGKDGHYFEDNDERLIFFSRGVIETVKKLRWAPDIVHCHGWFTSLVPLYLKKAFHDDPLFANSKVVYSVYNDDFTNTFRTDFKAKLRVPGIYEPDIAILNDHNFVDISKLAITHSDGIIQGSPEINDTLSSFIQHSGKPVLGYYPADEIVDKYSDFYDQILNVPNEK